MRLGRRRWVVTFTGALALVVTTTLAAFAGGVGTVVEAPDATSLALAVSHHAFTDGSTTDVVVTPAGEHDMLAVAVALAGALPSRASVLFPNRGTAPEIARVTGGPDTADPPRVWVLGGAAPGVSSGYDVRRLDGDAAAVASKLLEQGPVAGTADRYVLFPAGDWPAAAVAAAFAASAGLPLVPVRDAKLPAGVVPAGRTAIAVGAVTVPNGFADVQRIQGGNPAVLSADAVPFYANEQPGGSPPLARPTRPVAADGFGPDATAAFLASVVVALGQDAGATSPLLLTQGRPDAPQVATCQAMPVTADSAAECVVVAGETTTYVGLSGRGAAAGVLPATGGTSTATTAAALLVVAALASIISRRRWT